jgi:hypothetical protein
MLSAFVGPCYLNSGARLGKFRSAEVRGVVRSRVSRGLGAMCRGDVRSQREHVWVRKHQVHGFALRRNSSFGCVAAGSKALGQRRPRADPRGAAAPLERSWQVSRSRIRGRVGRQLLVRGSWLSARACVCAAGAVCAGGRCWPPPAGPPGAAACPGGLRWPVCCFGVLIFHWGCKFSFAAPLGPSRCCCPPSLPPGGYKARRRGLLAAHTHAHTAHPPSQREAELRAENSCEASPRRPARAAPSPRARKRMARRSQQLP